MGKQNSLLLFQDEKKKKKKKKKKKEEEEKKNEQLNKAEKEESEQWNRNKANNENENDGNNNTNKQNMEKNHPKALLANDDDDFFRSKVSDETFQSTTISDGKDELCITTKSSSCPVISLPKNLPIGTSTTKAKDLVSQYPMQMTTNSHNMEDNHRKVVAATADDDVINHPFLPETSIKSTSISNKEEKQYNTTRSRLTSSGDIIQTCTTSSNETRLRNSSSHHQDNYDAENIDMINKAKELRSILKNQDCAIDIPIRECRRLITSAIISSKENPRRSSRNKSIPSEERPIKISRSIVDHAIANAFSLHNPTFVQTKLENNNKEDENVEEKEEEEEEEMEPEKEKEKEKVVVVVVDRNNIENNNNNN